MTDLTTEQALATADQAEQWLRTRDPIDQRREDWIGGRSANTLRTYATQFGLFARWCARRYTISVPADPQTVRAYLESRSAEGVSASTLRTGVAAIAAAHISEGHPDPTRDDVVRLALRRFTKAARLRNGPPAQAAPLTYIQLLQLLSVANRPRRGSRGMETPAAAADRALIERPLFGVMFSGMLRRSEAAALRWSDITRTMQGEGVLLIRASKTDQDGEGSFKPISPQTMVDLDDLRESRPDDAREAAIFTVNGRTLTGEQISRRIKAATRAAGLEDPQGRRFTGHSFRVGSAVTLAEDGVGLPEIMTSGRWQSSQMAARYIGAQLAQDTAMAKFLRRHDPARRNG